MPRDTKSLGLTVVGIAGFQLLQAWNNNAPSLAECRSAPAGDPTTKQQLIDADILVGSAALILGVSVAYMTGDKTALAVMAALFGTTALWHHLVLNGSQEGGY